MTTKEPLRPLLMATLKAVAIATAILLVLQYASLLFKLKPGQLSSALDDPLYVLFQLIGVVYYLIIVVPVMTAATLVFAYPLTRLLGNSPPWQSLLGAVALGAAVPFVCYAFTVPDEAYKPAIFGAIYGGLFGLLFLYERKRKLL